MGPGSFSVDYASQAIATLPTWLSPTSFPAPSLNGRVLNPLYRIPLLRVALPRSELNT
jgi:hypothetical protein